MQPSASATSAALSTASAKYRSRCLISPLRISLANSPSGKHKNSCSEASIKVWSKGGTGFVTHRQQRGGGIHSLVLMHPNLLRPQNCNYEYYVLHQYKPPKHPTLLFKPSSIPRFRTVRHQDTVLLVNSTA